MPRMRGFALSAGHGTRATAPTAAAAPAPKRSGPPQPSKAGVTVTLYATVSDLPAHLQRRPLSQNEVDAVMVRPAGRAARGAGHGAQAP